MLVLAFQVLKSALSLAFGLTALAVVQRWTTHDRQRYTGWWLTAAAFTLGSVVSTAMLFAAIAAFSAGPGSPLWNEVVRWMPVTNHGQVLLKIVFAGLLIVLPIVGQRRLSSFRRVGGGLLVLALLAGGWLGWRSGSLTMGQQYAVIATSSLTLLVVLSVALLIHLSIDSMDRLLWLALCTYAFSLALGALWTGALSPIGIPEVWRPPVWMIQSIYALTALVMLALAWRFAVLQRRRVDVPAPFASLQMPKARLFGE